MRISATLVPIRCDSIFPLYHFTLAAKSCKKPGNSSLEASGPPRCLSFLFRLPISILLQYSLPCICVRARRAPAPPRRIQPSPPHPRSTLPPPEPSQVCRLSPFGRYGCETLIAGTCVQHVKGAAGSCHTAPAGTPSPSTPRLFTNNSLGVALVLASLRPLLSTARILPFCFAILASDRHLNFTCCCCWRFRGTAHRLHLQADRIRQPPPKLSADHAPTGRLPKSPIRTVVLFSSQRRRWRRETRKSKLALHKTAVEPPHRQRSFSVSCLRGAKHLLLHVYCYCLTQRQPIPPKPDEAALARIYTRRHKLAEIGAPEHRHRP